MDIELRKRKFIQNFLQLKNEELIEKLEYLLYSEKEKHEFSPLSIEELTSIIEQAENDAANNKLHDANELLKDIEEWK